MGDETLSAPAILSLIDSNGSATDSWPLEGKRTFKIGRAKTNEVALNSSWISRQHAMVQIEENGAFNVLDMGSSNGTFVNGNRIFSPTQLRTGDLIQIGKKITLSFIQNTTIDLPDEDDDDDDDDDKTVAFMEKEEVTVLICDIRDFTTLSEEIGDKQISDILKLWTFEVNKAVNHYKGNVDKFIGDAVMAIWASTGSVRQSVHSALACAVKISELTHAIGSKLPDLPRPLATGAAINTGEAVVGNIGVDGNRDYTVIGDVINVAFRLEGLTNKVDRQIIIGQETGSFLDHHHRDSYFHINDYQVKGKKEPISAYGTDFASLKQYLDLTA